MEHISRIGFELECEIVHGKTDYTKLGVSTAHDGSIHGCGGQCGLLGLSCVEFRSNPYVDVAKFEPFFKHIEKLRAGKLYHFNESMGFHIHVSFTEGETDDIGIPKTIYSPEFVKYFHARLKKEFPDVYETRGKNRYCALADMRYGKTTLDRIMTGERYQAVNFRSMDRHHTVEFRIFPANKPSELRKYVEFVQRTVNEFLATDEGRVHYSLRDILPRKSVYDAGTTEVRYRVKRRRASDSRYFNDPVEFGMLNDMRGMANEEYAKTGGRYGSDGVGLITTPDKKRYVPTLALRSVRTVKVRREIPGYITSKGGKKTTISKLRKPNV